MSFTATGKCFYCGNPINRDAQTYIYAEIRHHYKNGATRDSDRNFHQSCFEKFKDKDGRPFNPGTRYEVLSAETVRPRAKAQLGEEVVALRNKT
jgi:hypothetical protein